MGDHAEDEIFKEIHGHYPWEEEAPFINARPHKRSNGVSIGRMQWRGVKNYVNTFVNHDNATIRKIVEGYCVHVLEMDKQEVSTSNNEKLASRIQGDFKEFQNWWKVHNAKYRRDMKSRRQEKK